MFNECGWGGLDLLVIGNIELSFVYFTGTGTWWSWIRFIFAINSFISWKINTERRRKILVLFLKKTREKRVVKIREIFGKKSASIGDLQGQSSSILRGDGLKK